jgi:sarcosine oxidase, subunit beta
MDLVTTADVVIVGGGVVGLSIAYHLAKRGCTRVAVLEQNALGSGATGRSVGGIRQQFSTAVNVQLSRLSLQEFLHFQDEMGVNPGLRQDGYLFLATTPEEAVYFWDNVEMQRNLGVPVEYMAPGQILDLVPQLNIADVVAATFCPTDGYGDPYAVAMGYAEQARARGVRIYQQTEVVAIEREKGRVVSVATPQGKIQTRTVVNAAGPWAAAIGHMVGVMLPIQPFRRQYFMTDVFADLPERLPMVIDFRMHFYFRREGLGILLGMTDVSEPPSFNTAVDWGFLEATVQQATHRCRVLERATMKQAIAGLYDTTPDDNPILGCIPDIEGFICAAGFSGHGFMHSPATGLLIAELILDGEVRTIDLNPLTFTRFTEGHGYREVHVV